MRERIIEGMADILWGLAWAAHVDEARCSSLSGVEITEVMPRPPAGAHVQAERIARSFEHVNESTLDVLFTRACEEAGISEVTHEMGYMAGRFGNYLAFMADGHGISWYDDYPEFGMTTPYDGGQASVELQWLAESTCDDCLTRQARHQAKHKRARRERMTRAQRVGSPIGMMVLARRACEGHHER